jgi:hypothetical protein
MDVLNAMSFEEVIRRAQVIMQWPAAHPDDQDLLNRVWTSDLFCLK